MTARAPIKDRIIAALKANGGRMPYWKLAQEVFPKDQFPNAWNYPTRGGPHGCYMALSRALRVHGFTVIYKDSAVCHSNVMMGKNR